jgi:hypothetical protein
MRHYNRPRRASLLTSHFRSIGYQAWQGYLNFDRGILAISSEIDLFDHSDDRADLLKSSLNFRYIPQTQLSLYLEEWLVSRQSIEPILAAVVNYQPQTELILARESGVSLDICWCQNLKVSPPNC